jgi:enoyl-CoA hydratase/carnithine racemase
MPVLAKHNKFNQVTLQELNEATDAIRASSAVKGVIVTSLKKVFIVGADITEFTATFPDAWRDNPIHRNRHASLGR